MVVPLPFDWMNGDDAEMRRLRPRCTTRRRGFQLKRGLRLSIWTWLVPLGAVLGAVHLVVFAAFLFLALVP